jgi:hypothetical protein
MVTYAQPLGSQTAVYRSTWPTPIFSKPGQTLVSIPSLALLNSVENAQTDVFLSHWYTSKVTVSLSWVTISIKRNWGSSSSVELTKVASRGIQGVGRVVEGNGVDRGKDGAGVGPQGFFLVGNQVGAPVRSSQINSSRGGPPPKQVKFASKSVAFNCLQTGGGRVAALS